MTYYKTSLTERFFIVNNYKESRISEDNLSQLSKNAKTLEDYQEFKNLSKKSFNSYYQEQLELFKEYDKSFNKTNFIIKHKDYNMIEEIISYFYYNDNINEKDIYNIVLKCVYIDRQTDYDILQFIEQYSKN